MTATHYEGLIPRPQGCEHTAMDRIALFLLMVTLVGHRDDPPGTVVCPSGLLKDR